GHSNFTEFLTPAVHDLEEAPLENYKKIQLHSETDSSEQGHTAVAGSNPAVSGHSESSEGGGPVDHTALEWGLMIASVLWTLFTGFLAYILYLRNPGVRQKIMSMVSAQKIFTVLYNKYYVDELYEAVVVTPIRKLFAFLGAFDLMIVDGLVNLAGFIGRALGMFAGIFDNEIVDGAVNGTGWTAQTGGRGFSFLQSGRIQTVIGSSLIIFVVLVIAVVLFMG
ncbi:MAG: hypothetical protein GY866_03265, partial [Proteobacteria bacterium]|nr:hypothetical protein [Pseudomonadota bacterium]